MSSINGGFPASGTRILMAASPLTGATVVLPDSMANILLWITPAGTLATLTLQLPSDAGSFIGQEIHVGSSKAITAVTVTGASTIYNSITVLQIGDLFVIEKVAANTWANQE